MSNLLLNYYKPKKTVLLYLDTDQELQDLRTKLKDHKKAILTTSGRDEIISNWNSPHWHYIIWTYLTNQDDRWVVIVLDTQKKTATIHTATTSAQAEKEKKEVVGFLQQLNGLNNAKDPGLDTDTKNWSSTESGYISILYITKLLKRIEKGGDISTILVANFEDKKDGGKSRMDEVKEKFEKLRKEIHQLPSLEHLASLQGKTPDTPLSTTVGQIKGNIEKLLRDTKTKWTAYINHIDPNDINARMFTDFVPMAGQLLVFINKALESPKELSDYQQLNKEWGNMSDTYDSKRDYLNAWYTLRLLLNQWEELNKKPLQNLELSSADKMKLAELGGLRKEKELAEKEKLRLAQELDKKEQELKTSKTPKTTPTLPKKYSWETPPLSQTLTEDIQKKINLAYNSKNYLQGYYVSLLKVFLNWEYSGNEDQQKAISNKKSDINKCLNYLENSQGVKVEQN